MRTLSNGGPRIGLGKMRSWEGADAISEKLAEDGYGSAGGGKDTGEGETDSAKAKPGPSRESVTKVSLVLVD